MGTTGEPATPGEAVRSRRLAAGLTQRELARLAGISVRALRELEQGRSRSPRATSVHGLAAALGLGAAERDALLAAGGTGPAAGADPAGRGLRVAVLGPLSVRRGGQPVPLQAPRQRTLLGLLALRPGQGVSDAEAVDVLWGEDPPPASLALLHNYVARLRRLLEPDRPAGAPAQVVLRDHGGYRLSLELPGDELDLARFHELIAAAGRARAAGDPEQAFGLLAGALGCWRGELLADADASGRLRRHPAAVAAGRRRIEAGVALADVAAGLGRHQQVAALLEPLVREEPLHEGLAARLMLALVGSGEQVAALRLFTEVRERLADELGVDPGDELKAAHLRVLRGGPRATGTGAGGPAATTTADPAAPMAAATRSPRPVAPAQLPATIASFTGRTEQLAQLAALVDAGGDGAAPAAVVITAISGTAGVGKTALAVRFAHQIRDRYPDGQLFIDLRGYALTPPLQPVQALAHLLIGLGVEPDAIPADQDQAAGLYRSRLAGRRMLVLLDNANRPDQVRPLLPGTAGCVVLITSRDRLGGLVAHDDARRLTLDVLPPREAVDLLARMLGPDRVAAEDEAAAELARACAYLPLALRLAAANLADQPKLAIAVAVAELRSGQRLDALTVPGDEHGAVRAAFDLSYRRLPADARRLFRRLGLVPGPDVTAPAAAALAGAATTAAQAERLLGELVRVHLLDQTVPGRFAFHDLLRDYAAERARHDDSDTDRDEAVGRLFDFYLTTADAAGRLLYPSMLRLPRPPGDMSRPRPRPVGFRDHAAAVAWLDAERPNLIAAIQRADECGQTSMAWLLADALRGYFLSRRTNVDWLVAAHSALTSATLAGNHAAQAALQLSLGDFHQSAGRQLEAIEYYTSALELAGRTGWAESQAATLNNLGLALTELGRLAEAADHHTRALALNRQLGRLASQARNLINLGIVTRELGRPAQAIDYHTQALAISRAIDSPHCEAAAHSGLGTAFRTLGRLGEAQDQYALSLALARQIGDRPGEAFTLDSLAACRREAGGYTQALDLAGSALALARDLDDPVLEALTSNTLAETRVRLGEYQQALEHYHHALDKARAAGSRLQETVALIGLADAHRYLGGLGQALTHACDALALARQVGYRILECQALTVLAQVNLAELNLADGDPGGGLHRAMGRVEQALEIQQSTGDRLGQARALTVLGQLLHKAGDRPGALARWQQAHALFGAIGTPEADEVSRLIRAGVAR
jgi:DNA-binding SARP family transcriptional activator/Tfp pilus assembly protein PilF/DNA-binding XRE family transcriptional regulator